MTKAQSRSDREARGSLVLYPNRPHEPEHERVVHAELGRRLAALQGLEFAGEYQEPHAYAGRLYLVPSDSIIGLDHAERLGIKSELDLYGSVAPQPFVVTKAITHPLFDPHAYAPDGWSAEFGQRVRDSVLSGVTVFTLEDAREAGARLLRSGPLRIKPVLASGGRGQSLVADARALARALAALDSAGLSSCGLVLEEQLDQITTYSVGQVRVADLLASYCGTQRLTRDNSGEAVYGGSDLLFALGGFEVLLGLELSEQARLAVAQARVYDAAALDCFPGFFASRRNYDIGQGRDAQGRFKSGVLEQSWRIGGASGAEVAALQAFRSGAAAQAIHASTVELYGQRQAPPPDAEILFQGVDDEGGPITKCVMVKPYGNPK